MFIFIDLPLLGTISKVFEVIISKGEEYESKKRIISAIVVGVCIIVMAIMGLGFMSILLGAAWLLFAVIIPAGSKKNKKEAP